MMNFSRHLTATRSLRVSVALPDTISPGNFLKGSVTATRLLRQPCLCFDRPQSTLSSDASRDVNDRFAQVRHQQEQDKKSLPPSCPCEAGDDLDSPLDGDVDIIVGLAGRCVVDEKKYAKESLQKIRVTHASFVSSEGKRLMAWSREMDGEDSEVPPLKIPQGEGDLDDLGDLHLEEQHRDRKSKMPKDGGQYRMTNQSASREQSTIDLFASSPLCLRVQKQEHQYSSNGMVPFPVLSYAFGCRLPSSCPPTFHGHFCKINYWIYVRIIVDGTSTALHRFPILVVASPPPIPAPSLPSIFQHCLLSSSSSSSSSSSTSSSSLSAPASSDQPHTLPPTSMYSCNLLDPSPDTRHAIQMYLNEYPLYDTSSINTNLPHSDHPSTTSQASPTSSISSSSLPTVYQISTPWSFPSQHHSSTSSLSSSSSTSTSTSTPTPESASVSSFLHTNDALVCRALVSSTGGQSISLNLALDFSKSIVPIYKVLILLDSHELIPRPARSPSTTSHAPSYSHRLTIARSASHAHSALFLPYTLFLPTSSPHSARTPAPFSWDLISLSYTVSLSFIIALPPSIGTLLPSPHSVLSALEHASNEKAHHIQHEAQQRSQALTSVAAIMAVASAAASGRHTASATFSRLREAVDPKVERGNQGEGREGHASSSSLSEMTRSAIQTGESSAHTIRPSSSSTSPSASPISPPTFNPSHPLITMRHGLLQSLTATDAVLVRINAERLSMLKDVISSFDDDVTRMTSTVMSGRGLHTPSPPRYHHHHHHHHPSVHPHHSLHPLLSHPLALHHHSSSSSSVSTQPTSSLSSLPPKERIDAISFVVDPFGAGSSPHDLTEPPHSVLHWEIPVFKQAQLLQHPPPSLSNASLNTSSMVWSASDPGITYSPSTQLFHIDLDAGT